MLFADHVGNTLYQFYIVMFAWNHFVDLQQLERLKDATHYHTIAAKAAVEQRIKILEKLKEKEHYLGTITTSHRGYTCPYIACM